MEFCTRARNLRSWLRISCSRSSFCRNANSCRTITSAMIATAKATTIMWSGASVNAVTTSITETTSTATYGIRL